MSVPKTFSSARTLSHSNFKCQILLSFSLLFMNFIETTLGLSSLYHICYSPSFFILCSSCDCFVTSHPPQSLPYLTSYCFLLLHSLVLPSLIAHLDFLLSLLNVTIVEQRDPKVLLTDGAEKKTCKINCYRDKHVDCT